MVGKKIKEESEKKGVSPSELAEKLGTSTQNMYRIFQKESVSSDILIQVSTVLNVPVASFFDETEGTFVTSREKELEEKLQQHEKDAKHQADYIKLLKEKIEILNEKLDFLEERVSIKQMIIDNYESQISSDPLLAKMVFEYIKTNNPKEENLELYNLVLLLIGKIAMFEFLEKITNLSGDMLKLYTELSSDKDVMNLKVKMKSLSESIKKQKAVHQSSTKDNKKRT